MQNELRVGLDFSAPVPLHTDISSGIFEGYEVDLIKELSTRLDVKLIYEVSLWKDILQKLQQGQLDIICSAVTITPGRKSFLDFSIPYLSFRLCAVTIKENDIHSIDQLYKKKIGVRKATEAEKYITNKGADMVLSDTNEELYDGLKKSKIDLVIDDSPIAGAFVKQNSDLKIALFLPGTESQYAIAMMKGNLSLKNDIDKVLNDMKENDFLKKLNDKWFKDSIL